MAWSFNAGSIRRGATVRWAFWWGEPVHEYRGIQVVQARPVPMTSGGLGIILESELDVAAPGVKMEVLGPGYTYFASVTNVGPFDAQYEIQGQQVG